MRRYLLVGLMTMTLLFGAIGVAALPAQAVTCQGFDCVEDEISKPKYNTGQNKSVGSVANTIVDTFLYVVGAASIVMIVVGGIQYSISSGDANKVKKAKDTVVYAALGLAVAVLAYAIVNFVITKV